MFHQIWEAWVIISWSILPAPLSLLLFWEFYYMFKGKFANVPPAGLLHSVHFSSSFFPSALWIISIHLSSSSFSCCSNLVLNPFSDFFFPLENVLSVATSLPWERSECLKYRQALYIISLSGSHPTCQSSQALFFDDKSALLPPPSGSHPGQPSKNSHGGSDEKVEQG